MPEKYKNHIIAFLCVLTIILAVALWVSRWATPAPSGSTASAMMGDMPMVIKTFIVQPGQPVPTVNFTVRQDSTGGWDFHIVTTKLTFTPEKIDGAPVLGEGHVHLYVDGNLVVVLSPWYHMDPLPPGRHILRVALANNDHSLYEYQGKTIDQTQTIIVK